MLDCDLISSNKTYEQYSSEAFFDNTETHDSTGLDSDRILQFDGNDTVETDSDFDITDLTEAEDIHLRMLMSHLATHQLQIKLLILL